VNVVWKKSKSCYAKGNNGTGRSCLDFSASTGLIRGSTSKFISSFIVFNGVTNAICLLNLLQLCQFEMIKFVIV